MWRLCVCALTAHTHTRLHILSCATHPIIGWTAIKIWAKRKRRPFFFHKKKTMQAMRVHSLFRSSHSVYRVCEGQDIWHFASLILFCPSTEVTFIKFHQVSRIWILNDSTVVYPRVMCAYVRACTLGCRIWAGQRSISSQFSTTRGRNCQKLTRARSPKTENHALIFSKDQGRIRGTTNVTFQVSLSRRGWKLITNRCSRESDY